MAVNTNFQVPFLPQEGITSQILSAIQMANEQNFQRQRLSILNQSQQGLAQQRQSQADVNQARTANIKAKTDAYAATQDSLNNWRDAQTDLLTTKNAYEQLTDPIKKKQMEGLLTITQAKADAAAQNVAFMYKSYGVMNDQLDAAIKDPQQNAGAKSVVDNYMESGNVDKALAAQQHFIELAGKPELEKAVQDELAKTPQAQSKMNLQGAQAQAAKAGAVEKLAQAGKAKAETGKGSMDAYHVYDPAVGGRRYATAAEIQSNPVLQQGAPEKFPPGEFAKQVTGTNALVDAQRDISRARIAYDKAGDLSANDKAQVSQIISDDGFKAHFLGSTLPVDWMNQLVKMKSYNDLSQVGKEAVVGYIGSKTAAPSYTRALLNSARQSDTTMKLEEAMIPNPLLDHATRTLMLNRFQDKIDQLSQGFVQIPGIPRPREVRQSIETQPVLNNMNMLMDKLGQNPSQPLQATPGAGGLSGYAPPQQ